MTGLGLRLIVSGGREAITRLLILAAAVGLGTGLLLATVAATNATVTWNNRHAWFWTGTAYVPPRPGERGHRATVVAPRRRHLRRPAGLPLRRGRHRRLVPGAAGHPA